MIKRRIKRNFDEQLATVSSLTSDTCTPQDRTIYETKPNKKRTWHRNRVWCKDDPRTQVGGDPRVKDMHDRLTKDQTQNEEKVEKGQHRQPGPLRWRYNRIWRKDLVWKKEHSKKQVSLSMASVPAPSSAEVVAPQSKAKATSLSSTDSSKVAVPVLKTAPISVPIQNSETSQSKASASAEIVALQSKAKTIAPSNTDSAKETAFISKTTTTSASSAKPVTSKREASSVSVTTEITVSRTVTGSTNKAVTTVSNAGLITTHNDSLTCRDKMAPTTAAICVPPSEEKTGTSPVKKPQSSPPTEEKMEQKSLKRKRSASHNVPNKRVLLTSSADDTRPSSCWLWSIETLMEQLCLAFEGFFF